MRLGGVNGGAVVSGLAWSYAPPRASGSGTPTASAVAQPQPQRQRQPHAVAVAVAVAQGQVSGGREGLGVGIQRNGKSIQRQRYATRS